MRFRFLHSVAWFVALAGLRAAELVPPGAALLEAAQSIEDAHPRGVAALLSSSLSDEVFWSTGHSREVKCWNASSGKLVREMAMNTPGRALAFSPSRKFLAAGGGEFAQDNYRGGVTLWGTEDWQEKRRIDFVSGDINALAFIDDHTLVGAGHNGVRVWNVESGELLHHLQTDAGVLVMDHLPEQHLLGIGTFSTSSFLIDTREWKIVSEFHREPREKKIFEPRSMAFAAAGEHLRVGSWGLVGWEVASGKRLADIPLNTLIWACVNWGDGRLIAGGGEHKQAGRLWVCGTRSGEILQELRAHADAVSALAVGPGKDLILSGGADGKHSRLESGALTRV